MNPVPIAPTFGDETEMTIAVNLGGAAENKKPTDDGLTSLETFAPELHEKISRYIGNFQKYMKIQSSLDWSAYDVANQAFDAMQSTIARQKLAAYPPDYTIEIARNACGTLEFNRASEMIALGYTSARECLVHVAKED